MVAARGVQTVGSAISLRARARANLPSSSSSVPGFAMNTDKLKKLQSQVRIGGKGTPRRKKKVVHATAATDDKKLESSLKKLSLNPIPGIEEVNMMKDDGTVIHFNNPKAKASLAANTFVITGHGETRQVADMLPGMLAQLSPDGIGQLKRLAAAAPRHAHQAGQSAPRPGAADDYDEVPALAGDFDEAAKREVAKTEVKAE